MANGQVSHVEEYLGSNGGSQEGESDGQLLDRYLRHRDEGAFAALVQRYGRLVLGVCQRVLQDGHEAEDAFQATFLVLIRKADALDKRQPLGSWLYEVAYRTALKARGNAARRRIRERQAGATMSAQPNGETQWQELRIVLDEELSRLPNKYRAPLVLCYLQGKSNQEAARELGWPGGSMSRRISKGRQILRDRLVRRGILFSPALLFTLLPKKALAVVVPSPLLTATLQAAMLFGKSTLITAGGTSAKVIALAEEVAKTLRKPALRIGAKALIVLAVFGGAGAGAVALTPASSWNDVWTKFNEWVASCGHSKNAGQENLMRQWRLRDTLTASPGSVLSVALNVEGTRLAAGTADSQIKLWNLSSGGEAAKGIVSGAPLPGHDGPVNCVAFSPDGVLASGSQDRTIKLWDINTRQLKTTLRGHEDAVLAVAFSADGKTLASAGADHAVRLWDLSRRQEIKRLEGHEGPVEAVAFATDRATLVSGSQDGTVRFWDLSTGLQKAVWQAHTGGVSALAFSPNGRILATAGQDAKVRLWDLAREKTLTTFTGHSGPVRSVAFAPGGAAVFSAGQDRTMKQWLVGLGKEGIVFEENASAVNAVACAGNPIRLANGSADGKVQLWELEWPELARK